MHRPAPQPRRRPMIRRLIPVLFPIILGVATGRPGRAGESAKPVDFTREIRPILADKCFRGHGPDGAKRKAGLRLDRRDDALAARDGRRVLVPGDPEASELCFRVSVEDPSVRWPVRRDVNADALSGRGVALIDMLASAWGVEGLGEDGKRVWFEVELR